MSLAWSSCWVNGSGVVPASLLCDYLIIVQVLYLNLGSSGPYLFMESDVPPMLLLHLHLELLLQLL